ncbi:hypothetical protein [Candidatus Nanosynsacchari sp. TM7_ANC_38.39_G1_1]|uniref:hypothetical protein n=1 Tax=Candidatus Nanosynsacchari sp. TM7_ANC_38.39_G1_1 TaxID=1986206 RepID=UPI00101C0EF2|nr:hypothetical protein [Candidatus Nanosynsacchari sp. TM7_ANC_38.39_G1_1]RYC73718.1 hypothetical protein G1ANC_00324 [Candidatus Nanosynsacchari sp. TM7_ANC_38.39_G1_1]
MSDDKNYTNVILEKIRSQMSAVLEIVSNQPTREEFNNLREEFDSLKTDVRTIKRAVVDNDKTTQHELELLDRRVAKLEESAS